MFRHALGNLNMREPFVFWSYFSDMRETIESRLAGFHGFVPACELKRLAPGLIAVLDAYGHGLTIEIERYEGLFAMIVSAGGDVGRFEAAQALMLTAPLAPGWLMRALRPRRDPGEAVHSGGLTLRLDGLRFAYGLANDRMVVVLLTDDAAFDVGPAAQSLARRLTADLLGEEDFGLSISDARLMRYGDWLAASPGGRSWPISDLAIRFDAIFHPPPRMAPSSVTGPRLALSA